MSTTDITATNPRDVYRKVTDAIIHAIEQGVGNWRMPWHTSGGYAFSPINVASKKPYRGINTVCLWAAAQAKGYERGEWATYQQWQDKGAQVRKGEKATTVVFWKFANDSSESQDDGAESSRSRLLFTRGYSVFNAAQVDGYTRKADADIAMPERIAHAEAFFGAMGANVQHGGNRAFYSPASDYIQMPPFGAFTDSVSYYSTLAHEHTHWTAPASRCDRQLGKRFGDSAYAAEELIAELGAAFTCAHLGLSKTSGGPRAVHPIVASRAQGGLAGHLYGRIQGAAGYRLADRAGRRIGPHCGGGGMTTPRHRSTAYVKALSDRGRAWKPEPITNQFRFIVRMAYACHTANVPYDLLYNRTSEPRSEYSLPPKLSILACALFASRTAYRVRCTIGGMKIPPDIRELMAEISRKYGRQGGKTAAKNMTPQERTARAKKAAVVAAKKRTERRLERERQAKKRK